MIDIQPFIDKLDMLPAYMEYWINNPNMSLSHKFYTKAYDYGNVREYFIGNFTKSGWIIGENTMVWKKKTFEEYLITQNNLTNN